MSHVLFVFVHDRTKRLVVVNSEFVSTDWRHVATLDAVTILQRLVDGEDTIDDLKTQWLNSTEPAR